MAAILGANLAMVIQLHFDVLPIVCEMLSADPKSLYQITQELENKVLSKIGNRIKLIVAFDEASELQVANTSIRPGALTEILRVLRAILPFPIYSVFISTTAPPPRQRRPPIAGDSSSRVLQTLLSFWPPYTLVGYDDLSEPVGIGCTLDDVTKLEFMLGLGRPL